MIFNNVQLYNENAAVKYPLDDLHTEVIPNDILLDLSLTLPPGSGQVICTNIVCRSGYVFVSFETASMAVGHLITTTPVPFRILPLTMSCDGAGWVVLGPGALREFSIVGSSAAVDPRCIVPSISTLRKFKLKVNGFEYDFPSILKIVASPAALLARETRTIDTTPVETLVISRNDLALGTTVVKTGLVEYDPEDQPVATLAGVRPDSAGNIDIVLQTETPAEKAYLVPVRNTEGDPIGFTFMTSGMSGCPDAYKDLDGKIKKSDTGYGSAEAMPLDCMFPPGPDSPSPTYPCPEGY